MNLDQIKDVKIKEAEELFRFIGILNDTQDNHTVVTHDKEDKPEQLHWTRLSINSNFGSVIE